jgi:hypothetical protein
MNQTTTIISLDLIALIPLPYTNNEYARRRARVVPHSGFPAAPWFLAQHGGGLVPSDRLGGRREDRASVSTSGTAKPQSIQRMSSETTGSARQRLRPEVSVSNGARLSSRNAVRAAIRGLLADAELREQGVQDVLDPDVAGNPADFTHCEAKVLPTQFRQNSLFRDLQVFSR